MQDTKARQQAKTARQRLGKLRTRRVTTLRHAIVTSQAPARKLPGRRSALPSSQDAAKFDSTKSESLSSSVS